MNDPDVWAAFESTPAAIEPVANRDNSLQGFQRRLLEECGEKLGETREDLNEAAALVDRADMLLYSMTGNFTIPAGVSELLVDIADWKDARRG